MGDTEFENMKTILNILRTSEVAETKLFALDFLLGMYAARRFCTSLFYLFSIKAKIFFSRFNWN